MRLGITVDSIAPNLTGIGRYTWELCRGLAQTGEVEDLAYFRQDRWIRDPSDLLAGRHLRRSRLSRAVRDFRARRGFRDRLIHGTNYFLPDMTEAGVVTVHDMSIFLYPETHPAERVGEFERRFAQSLRRAGHIITDSHATRNDFIAQFSYAPERVTTVHLGVSRRFQPQSGFALRVDLKRIFGCDIGDYILSVATFEPRKRIESAILAHAQFCDRTRSTIPLVLVGAKGWVNDALHRLIDTEKARGRLIMLGFVDDTDLPTLYAGAKLFVYPSIYEGFGLPPIEAKACGTPVIVSNRSCLPEVTRGAAMTVDPDDLEALAAMMEQGLQDDNWREAAISAGLAVAADYSWEQCIDRTVDVYRMCGASAG